MRRGVCHTGGGDAGEAPEDANDPPHEGGAGRLGAVWPGPRGGYGPVGSPQAMGVGPGGAHAEPVLIENVHLYHIRMSLMPRIVVWYDP